MAFILSPLAGQAEEVSLADLSAYLNSLTTAEARFVQTTSYGDRLDIHTCVTHWGNKSFTFLHRVMRDSELIMECTEVRLFAGAKEGKVPGIVGLPIPDEVRRLCQV